MKIIKRNGKEENFDELIETTKKDDIKIIVLTCIINEFVINLLINTYWVHVISDANYVVLLSTRIFQALIKVIAGIISIKLLSKALPNFERRIK